MTLHSKLYSIIVVFILSTATLFSQNWKTIPDAFDGQCQQSFIDDVNRGSISLNTLPSRSQEFWIVYSDRENNRLKNKANGSNNGEKLKYMEPLYVKAVKDNWLHVYGFQDEEEKGWIEARFLVLSNWSLRTEGTVSIPRKAIILTSLDEMVGGNVKVDDVLAQKHYYNQPIVSESAKRGTPNSFKILFVLKEQDGSVLLSTNDVLKLGPLQNIDVVLGWMPKANVTKWNTRVALEPARSNDEVSHYNGKKLPGYRDLQKLKTCVEDNYCDDKPIVEFKVESIPSNRMRKPILNPLDDNIKEVVSIAKNSSELGEKQKDSLNAIIEILQRKSNITNIVFAVDATSSMGIYFPSVARSVSNIIKNNDKLNQNNELKFGLIVYRDYADGKEAYSVDALTTNFDKIQNKIRNTVCKSSPKDKDKEEAQYNGLIKGINKINFNPNESNVVILIGDCGNHKPDNEHNINDVIDVLYKNSVSLIAYQVANERGESYFTFNDDAQNYIKKTAKKILEGKNSSLSTQFKMIGNKTYKLLWLEDGVEQSFENMFGRFIYATRNKPMSPKYLEESVAETLTEYMLSVNQKLSDLRKWLAMGPTDVDVDNPPEGLIIDIQERLGLTRDEAIDFLNQTEVTTRAYVAIDYNGSGYKSQVPVVFLTDEERNQLKNSLEKLIADKDCITASDRKRCLQENLIEVCKSILGPKTSTKSIEDLTLNEVWNLILGIDFGNKKIKKKQLKDIISIDKRTFNDFYNSFTITAKDFIDNNYSNSDRYKSRRFSLFGSYYYWIPLEDMPGAKE